MAKSFGLRLIITEEAMDDCKYEKIIDASRRLKRAIWKTVDIETTQMLVRMFNTAYVGGDGQPLGSASHTLPLGGTFSNIPGAAASPSKVAIVADTTAMRQLPGHDGIVEGYEPEKVVFPTAQWATWEELVGSKFTPVTNNFAEINVVNSSLSLKLVPNKYWNNTTTHYMYLTDAPNKLNLRWRKRPEPTTWVENSQLLMNHAINGRWTRGWSDPRAAFCVNA
jgi:hypothetical protein